MQFICFDVLFVLTAEIEKCYFLTLERIMCIISQNDVSICLVTEVPRLCDCVYKS